MSALQTLVDAASLGGIYALLALGLAIVFSIAGLINFAHGELMTIAGYAIVLALTLSFPVAGAALVALLAGGVAALSMDAVAFRPMRRASPTSLLLTSFGLSEIIKVLLQNLISARSKPVPLAAWISQTVEVGGLQLRCIALISIATTALALVALMRYLRQTTTGIAMRAAAEDFTTVRLMGINGNRIIAIAFVLSGLLAGLAAFLWVAQRGSVDPLMGLTPVLKAFVAAIIGGLGSLPGAVLGGFALGAMEIGCDVLLPSQMLVYRDAFVFTAVIAILLVRPQGLLPALSAKRS